jgi:hypothetical protein
MNAEGASLDVTNNSSNNGAGIGIWTNSSINSSDWMISNLGGGNYVLHSARGGYSKVLTAGNTYSQVFQNEYSGYSSRWGFDKVGGTITNPLYDDDTEMTSEEFMADVLKNASLGILTAMINDIGSTGAISFELLDQLFNHQYELIGIVRDFFNDMSTFEWNIEGLITNDIAYNSGKLIGHAAMLAAGTVGTIYGAINFFGGITLTGASAVALGPSGGASAITIAVGLADTAVGTLEMGLSLTLAGTAISNGVSSFDQLMYSINNGGEPAYWNYRQKFIDAYGEAPEGMVNPQVHHVLPQKFVDKFIKAGINIHEPKYCSWVERTPHSQWSGWDNKDWEDFFVNNQSPTVQEILAFARQMATKYGFQIHF